MAIDREPLYKALAAKLRTAMGFEVSRHFRPLSMVPAGEQPWSCLLEVEEDPIQEMGYPPVHRIRPCLLVYLRIDDPQAPPGPEVNPLLRAIDSALEATDDEHAIRADAYATTLGGLVTYCWRAGPSVIERGDLGRQAELYVPLEMLVAE